MAAGGFYSLWSLALLLGIVQGIVPPRAPHQPQGNGTKLLSWNDTSLGLLSPRSMSVDWVSGTEQDGQYIYLEDGVGLIIEDILTTEKETFVAADLIPEDIYEYWIKPDLSKVLFSTNYTKQYRHSYFANYLILDLETGETTPLVEDQVGDVQYAEWCPTMDMIAFVKGNNLYIRNGSDVKQITSDGGPDMFHGVFDWVYEEEIFGSRGALWWSPDGEYLSYLSFNETGVPTFTIPYYMNNQKYPPPYPRELEIRYPKVGEKNPTVGLTLVDASTFEATSVETTGFPAEELIIGEVAWVTDGHDKLIYKAYDRVQEFEKYIVVDVESKTSTVTRERDGTDGWLDNSMAINYVGSLGLNSSNSGAYYIDMSDASGWMHLYLFPVASNGSSIPLTSGDWEVTSILKVDTARQLIYYLSTEQHSTERHLYSISYSTFKKTRLVSSAPAVWGASFSTNGGYYILSYQGPDVPYQELYTLNSTTRPLRTLTNNTALYDRLATYSLPKITYEELELSETGEKMNVMMRLPASYSTYTTKKYPVLFTPYGGPGAQEVLKSFESLNWNAYIASDPELEYITYTLDNRGTGYKGRAFRAQVARRLGSLEAQDQIFAAAELAKRSYVDAEHIGIWGWSYGGYLTSKVLEAQGAGNGTAAAPFSLGLITAPVSDWRLYDSMYTERYMKLPTAASNGAGYNTTAVRDPTGFKTVRGGFLLQHGTGDDNVHFQNSAALEDILVGGGVGPNKMQVQWFTDSDHSIRYDGANGFLYRQLSGRLYSEKNRVGEGARHAWGKRDMEEREERHQWSWDWEQEGQQEQEYTEEEYQEKVKEAMAEGGGRPCGRPIDRK
ncbi:hypothetical protein K402DRAFT_374166 [Aulographum hederae CBS 113979]|uniref:dipeptidyl-peptidase IV n=1 Tax=Aulographum hederae CBS 113979 TaxID=1176131 RepID=A0A6G1H5H0_9PEZI|nr:hypothetical protein K402DRAFT_374166 [Aulographum hederae CBS 113979]